MVDKSIFPILSVDRGEIRWENYLEELTPVQNHMGVFFKREDYFAPLGYGGVNGSKLRQCIYLFDKNSQAGGIISGSSVKSPQLSISSTVALHYGIRPVIQVIGATTPVTALRHPNVNIAAKLGSEFVISKVAYNPALQRMVQLLSKENPSFYVLQYGISTSEEEANEFYSLGAKQVKNFPYGAKDLVIPTGSGNSTISILLGVSKYRPPNLKRVHLIGIGPSKLDFIKHRLELMGVKEERLPELIYYDLIKSKYTTYQDEVPYSWGDIDMHPTYEGKVMKFLTETMPNLLCETTCVWLIGSKPSWEAMAPYLPESEPLMLSLYKDSNYALG